MIIDSYVHLPPAEKVKSLKASAEELIENLDKNKVDFAIVIPDNVPSPIGDLDSCLEITENNKRLFLMGTINILSDYKPTLDKLDDLFKNKKIVGVKIFPGHDPIYPTDKRLTPVYELCKKYDQPIVIHTGWNSNNPEVAKYNDPKYIVEIAKKFPKLKIVISHYFWPRVDYCYDLTKQVPNIYFDTSALADDEVIRETGLEKIKKVLIKTIKERPDKVISGTDYSMCDTKKHIDLINSLEISDINKERVFYKNAIDVFKLNVR